jgi:flagellar basal-body rod protein FlgB
MFLERLFQKTGIQVMKKGLDATALRQKVIASNMANVSTPGYKRKEVVFEQKLQESLSENVIGGKISNSKHIPIGKSRFSSINPEVVTDNSPELASGVNNVDVDLEMAELAKNQIQFSATATVIARRFRGLKAAIKGRV